MAAIKGKNTKPELLVRKFLHANGYRYKLHDKSFPGKPDIVLPKYKTVIFGHACFWHGHKNCKYFVVHKTRTDAGIHHYHLLLLSLSTFCFVPSFIFFGAFLELNIIIANGEGIRLEFKKAENLEWSVPNDFTESIWKEVSGWNEKGARMLNKRTLYLLQILFLCIDPIPMEDLLNQLNYSNRTSFRDRY